MAVYGPFLSQRIGLAARHLSADIYIFTGSAAMSDEEILERLTDIFRYVFDYEGQTLSLNMTSDDVEAWDSMSNITLAIEIEKRFKIKIKMANMENLKNITNLVALIRSSLSIPAP